MIKCPVCDVPFGPLQITNTTITLLVRCSCTATIRVHPDGRTGVVARLRRPEFVSGTDQERLVELFQIRRALLERVADASALLQLIEADRAATGLRVRKAALEHLILAQQTAQAKMMVKTIKPEALFAHLYKVLGKEIVDAMIAEALGGVS